MNSCPSLSSGDSKTVSAGAEGDDNLSMDSFDGSGDVHAKSNSEKSHGPTDDETTIAPVISIILTDKELVDSEELLTVEDSEEATWSGFNLILQNGLEAALGQVLGALTEVDRAALLDGLGGVIMTLSIGAARVLPAR